MNEKKRVAEVHERVAICRQMERWGINREKIRNAIDIYTWETVKDWAAFAAIRFSNNMEVIPKEFDYRFPNDFEVCDDYSYFFGNLT